MRTTPSIPPMPQGPPRMRRHNIRAATKEDDQQYEYEDQFHDLPAQQFYRFRLTCWKDLRLETRTPSPIYHLIGCSRDGLWMASSVRELRSRSSDSEKITINLGYVDLGHVDLLVQEGFYSNRTDFIRTAIRNQLDRQSESVKQSVARHQLELGLRHYSREDLEAVQAAGEKLHIQVLGLASIAEDVSPQLALRTIASIHVLGALHISPTLKAALSNRIR